MMVFFVDSLTNMNDARVFLANRKIFSQEGVNHLKVIICYLHVLLAVYFYLLIYKYLQQRDITLLIYLHLKLQEKIYDIPS